MFVVVVSVVNTSDDNTLAGIIKSTGRFVVVVGVLDDVAREGTAPTSMPSGAHRHENERRHTAGGNVCCTYC